MMLMLSIVVLLSVLSTTYADCRCGYRAAQSRIVGGKEAPDGYYPWMAAFNGFHILQNGSIIDMGSCGGSVINDEYILTAAHCIVPTPPSSQQVSEDMIKETQYYVAIGSNNIAQFNRDAIFGGNKPSYVHKVKTFTVHENYDPELWMDGMANDIALLRLEKPLTFGPRVSPVCLEEVQQFYYNIEVSGWGNTRTGYGAGPQMRHVNVSEVPKDRCNWKFIHPTQQICYSGGDVGTCHGDSGGPLVVSRRGTYHQVGIVSFSGPKCDDPMFSNGGTRVSGYVDWIKRNVVSGTWCEPVYN